MSPRPAATRRDREEPDPEPRPRGRGRDREPEPDPEPPSRGRSRSTRDAADEPDPPPSRGRSTRGRDADRDREPEGEGVSLNIDDAESRSGSFFQGGDAIGRFIFGMFNFKRKEDTRDKFSPALIGSWKTQDGAIEEVPYGVGDGWSISRDGQKLIPMKSQKGLDPSCGAYRFFAALVKLGMPKSFNTTPSVLDGLDCRLIMEPPPKGSNATRNLPIPDKVYVAPWESNGKGRTRTADPEPAPRSRTRTRDAEPDEPAPRRGRGRDPEPESEPEPAPRRGRGSKSDDEDLTEMAIEALIETLDLEKAAIKLKDLEDAILDCPALKGNKQAKAIAAHAATNAVLDLERGWTYDGKYVELA